VPRPVGGKKIKDRKKKESLKTRGRNKDKGIKKESGKKTEKLLNEQAGGVQNELQEGTPGILLPSAKRKRGGRC